MIEKGQRVKCTNSTCVHFNQEGTFIGYIANGLHVEFDSGETGLFLPDELRKI